MKEKKSKKAVKIIAAVLGTLLALYCAYYLTAIIAFGDSMPMPLGAGAAVVLTGSMEPTLSANDLIFVVRSSEYKISDVVVYSTAGTPVVHRVIDIDEENGIIVTQGDANNTDDGWIDASALKGKFVFRIPFVGLLIKAIKSLPGVIIIIGLSAFLMIRSRRNEQKEKTDGLHDIREEIEKLKSEMTAGQDENAADGDKPDGDQDGETSPPETKE